MTNAVETDDATVTSTFQDLLVSSLLVVLRVPTEAMVDRAVLPGPNPRVGSEAHLSSNDAANVLTSGASSLVQFGNFRTAGFDTVSGGDGRPGPIADGGSNA